MKVTQKEINELQKIDRLFDEIKEIYEGLSPDLKQKFVMLGGEAGSLDYAVNFGTLAIGEIVKECTKDTKTLIENFRDWCRDQAEIYNKKYSAQHEDKFMVIDRTWDLWRDDCDMFAYASDYLLDEYPEWFDDCDTVEECERTLKDEYEKGGFAPDYLDDERMNLSFGQAKLAGKTILEVGSRGGWMGTCHGLDIISLNTIGELLTSEFDQWMIYVDKETGELCKSEHHHDGSNFYTYRELLCDLDTFEEILDNRKPGEIDSLVEKYSAPMGWRVAEIYGWDLGNAGKEKNPLEQKIELAKKESAKEDNEKVCEGKETIR